VFKQFGKIFNRVMSQVQWHITRLIEAAVKNAIAQRLNSCLV